MIDWVIDWAYPDISMSFPNMAPNRKTGRYNRTKPARRSMNIPVKKAGIHSGLYSKTPNMAAIGAKMITLAPRYATIIRNTRGIRIKIASIRFYVFYIFWINMTPFNKITELKKDFRNTWGCFIWIPSTPHHIEICQIYRIGSKLDFGDYK